MSEFEVPAAIAEQEEYIKRQKSCGEVLGKSHRFAPAAQGWPGSWTECMVCGVTETPEDYARKLAVEAAGRPRPRIK